MSSVHTGQPTSGGFVEAFRLVDSLWARFFAPPADLSVAEWSDGHLVLPREMSAEPGPMRIARTPYLRQILDDINDPAVEEVDLCFATQLGKSTALLATLGFVVDIEPAPIMLVLPTLDVAKKFSKQRIAPLIGANRVLRDKIGDPKARAGDNTVLVKEFAGGILVITGANSPAGLASMPAKWLLLDEVDDYPEDAGGQGDPTAIASARQDTFARRKRIKSSSPKRPKGRSLIEAEFELGTGFRWYMPCPHCGHMQTLRWANLKWVSDPAPRPETAAYACESCGALIDERHKHTMLPAGEWRAERPGLRKRTYHLNSLNSPLGWLSWQTLVDEWVKAGRKKDEGDPKALRTFINTRLAETWEEQAEKLAANELQEKAEAFPLGTVPRDALILVAFVDVQDDRFEFGVWGLNDRGEMWSVDHRVIPANPGIEADWHKVDALLLTRYPHALGGTVGIEAAAVDTGGHYTHDVYRFVRRVPSWRRVAATKGMDRPGMPILGKAQPVDVNTRGGVIKHGVKLWTVGVNAAKDLLLARIRNGRVHCSRELPATWFEQLAAEHRVRARTARGERYVWVKKNPGARNEALDIAVGALWCAERLGVSRWPQKYWQVLRDRIAPDLLTQVQDSSAEERPAADRAQPEAADGAPPDTQAGAPANVQTSAPRPRPAAPRRAGFVHRWK